MATSVLSGVLVDGKLVVPAEVREELGLKDGDKVDFVINHPLPISPPADPAHNPFEKWVGALPAFNSVEEVNAYYRDLRDDEEGGLTKW